MLPSSVILAKTRETSRPAGGCVNLFAGTERADRRSARTFPHAPDRAGSGTEPGGGYLAQHARIAVRGRVPQADPLPIGCANESWRSGGTDVDQRWADACQQPGRP